MRVQLESGGIDAIRAETVILPCLRRGGPPRDLPQGLVALDRRLSGRLADALASGDFKANAGDRLVVYGPRGGDWVRCVLLGLGEADKLTDEGLREVGGHVGREFKRSSCDRIALVIPSVSELTNDHAACLLAEGAVLGAYRFDRYLSKKSLDDGASRPRRARKDAAPRLDLVYVRAPRSATTLKRRLAETVVVAECQTVARDLSNEPPNVLYPEALAREARRIAREVGLRCRVLDVPAMTRLGMGAILAVGQGSAHPPRMIVLEHVPGARRAGAGSGRGRGRKRAGETLALVGKGITFDSGGLSLKTASGMPDMKHDMSGAAAVLGAMRAIALLALPIRVVGILAVAENMPSANAYRPSDIIRSASGQTIEIVNTDAEGRLVLADAIDHAVKRHAPSALVDIATLTGAAMLALGSWASAGLTNDESLLEEVRAAGTATGEIVWPMPLFEPHEKAMRSKVADWKNSAGRDAGISTAAAFLRGFVGKTPWVHLDIAGSGMTSNQTPLHVGGGTGVGVRLMTQWVRSRAS
ncbi:MAG: leucyl aminopeptidase [Myxococcota bacterium]